MRFLWFVKIFRFCQFSGRGLVTVGLRSLSANFTAKVGSEDHHYLIHIADTSFSTNDAPDLSMTSRK